MKNQFRLWHSLAGLAVLLVGELLLLHADFHAGVFILAGAALGALYNTYVSMQVIQEVRSARHMLALLSVVVAEFVVFFAFQYKFLLMVEPGSFPTLSSAAVTLLLHSVMVFVFNPLYLPATALGEGLLLINTLAALGLVLFILQNVGQFRHSKALQ